ncbi:LysR family transcriptional regulator [Psychromonas sp. RZ22]|uniref:LysR family transcriptional regulator n=1 Tax=Psychromonas algarum TaxID=2555643 RepID=UPI0010686EE8|nr:LysR substrate-binding domain-containing protein [Psychromonas sp. RZ22]TEW54706.1 LysR family transcriptional regulator [Psychromonas sp. RZ22]
MEIKTLKTFITVASLKNFSAAAKELYTVQPNISRQISDLEKELDVKLFIRNTREVSLTEVGQLLLPEAIEIVANNTRVINLIKAAKDNQQSLTIGYLASACFTFLPQLVCEFSKLYPKIKISILEMSSKEQLDALLEKKIDISFSRPQPLLERKKFYCSEIYRDPLVATVSTGHYLANKEHLSFNELENENFILFKPEDTVDLHYHIMSNCEKNNFTPNITYHNGNIRSLMTAVSAGLGISFVPKCVQYIGLNECKFIPMQELSLTLALNLYHCSVDSPKHVTDFVNFCTSKEISLKKGLM